MKSAKLYLFILVFVLPYVLIYSAGMPRWLGRTVATSLSVFVISACFFWIGINPKVKIVSESGKLNQPQFAQVRPKFERGVRIVTVALGVFVCWTTTVPLARDLVRLIADKEPTRFTGTVFARSAPYMGIVLLAGSVRFSRNEPSYYLLYSAQQPHIRESYEFTVLPHSRFIVDFRKSESPTVSAPDRSRNAVTTSIDQQQASRWLGRYCAIPLAVHCLDQT